MKLSPGTATSIAAFLAAMQTALAAPFSSSEEKIMRFLWSSAASTDEKAELIYHDVRDNYNTRISFTRDKMFRRSDGVGGTWHFDKGKFIMTGLDTKEGFEVIFDPLTLSESQLVGRIPKGKFRGHKVVLKIPPK